MYDIESVILPYADCQPNHIILPSTLLDRMPALVSESGINPRFQSFFERLVIAVAGDKINYSVDVSKLFELTDKNVSLKEFSTMIDDAWSSHFSAMKSSNSSLMQTGIDIELNMDRFQEIHRNLIGGFNVITYHIDMNTDEFTGALVPKLTKAHTELLFTYKNNEFVLLPCFSAFTYE